MNVASSISKRPASLSIYPSYGSQANILAVNGDGTSSESSTDDEESDLEDAFKPYTPNRIPGVLSPPATSSLSFERRAIRSASLRNLSSYVSRDGAKNGLIMRATVGSYRKLTGVWLRTGAQSCSQARRSSLPLPALDLQIPCRQCLL